MVLLRSIQSNISPACCRLVMTVLALNCFFLQPASNMKNIWVIRVLRSIMSVVHVNLVKAEIRGPQLISNAFSYFVMR